MKFDEKQVEELAKWLCDKWGDDWHDGKVYHRRNAAELAALVEKMKEPVDAN